MQKASYFDKQKVILTNSKWCNFVKQQVIRQTASNLDKQQANL